MAAMTTAGGPPGKIDQTSVAGAAGGPPTKVAGAAGGGDATQVGGAADAGKGAGALGGGGGDLAAALKSLTEVIKSLAETISKMGTSGGGGGHAAGGCGGESKGATGMAGHVMGVQGSAATAGQYVAKTPTVASTAAQSGEDSSFEAQVAKLINQERAKYGLAPVSYSAVLDQAAEKHANQMGLTRKMAHDGIGDGDPGERIRAEGFRKAWGENVATGQTSPEQVVREWMASPAHRRNILDPNFRQMGVSQITGQDGRTYIAQEFGAA